MLPFYEALGFQVTYRQARPSPYAAVRREDIQLHFYEPEELEPERSYGSAIVVVPDAAALYRSFADALRAGYGKLPWSGIPRILRPRKKLGTGAGFSVVDPGGDWLLDGPEDPLRWGARIVAAPELRPQLANWARERYPSPSRSSRGKTSFTPASEPSTP